MLFFNKTNRGHNPNVIADSGTMNQQHSNSLPTLNVSDNTSYSLPLITEVAPEENKTQTLPTIFTNVFERDSVSRDNDVTSAEDTNDINLVDFEFFSC